MPRVPVVDARNDLAEILNRVAYGKERVVLTRRDKDVVAIVSMEDLRAIEELEDRIDLKEAKKVLDRNEPSVSLDDLKAKYRNEPKEVRMRASSGQAPRSMPKTAKKKVKK